MMDEWALYDTFKKTERNWFAYQFGLNANNFFIDNDSFIFEFNWTDHKVYRHRFSVYVCIFHIFH